MSTGDIAVYFIVRIVLILLSIAFLFPCINLLAISFSGEAAVISGRVGIIPVDFTLDAYKTVLDEGTVMRSMNFTIFLTVLYTVISVFMTTLCAYPLSKKRLKGRTGFLLIITFTMYFSGGMIPSYLLILELGMLSTIWALILPSCISAYNMILMKSFFNSIPDTLEEAAIIDGANDTQVLFRIYTPLSKPIIATLALFYAVGRWNGFSDALLYMKDSTRYPLQVVLVNLIKNSQLDAMEAAMGQQAYERIATEGLKAATLMFAVVPIILVYPWIQKYFTKGVMLGSIKG